MDTDFRLFPEQASNFAPEVDALYAFLCGVSGFFIVLIAFLIVYFAVKYRRGSAASRVIPSSHTLQYAVEASWIVIPFVLTMVMFVWGAKVYFAMAAPPQNALQIQLVGRQWMWKFQHPEGNAEINELHVPVNQPVQLSMISEDVIHSMYVPAFRVKHDVLPDRYTGIWFRPTRVGEYHLFCAEYCGAKHSAMIGRVIVQQPSAYQEWLSGREAGIPPAEAGRRLFEELRCISCHRGGGLDSRGPPLENLFGAQVRLQDGQSIVADENYLRESIVRPAAKVVAGYQPIMPSFEGQIGEEGLLQLIAYIKSLGSGERTGARL